MFMFITNLTVDIMFPLFIVAPIKHKYHGGHHDISASTFRSTWAKLAKVRKTKAWNSKLSGPWEALTWERGTDLGKMMEDVLRIFIFFVDYTLDISLFRYSIIYIYIV